MRTRSSARRQVVGGATRWAVMFLVVVLAIVLPAGPVGAGGDDDEPDDPDEQGDFGGDGGDDSTDFGGGDFGDYHEVTCDASLPGDQEDDALRQAGLTAAKLSLVGLIVSHLVENWGQTVRVNDWSRQPEWWKTELEEHGECHLYNRHPVTCEGEDGSDLPPGTGSGPESELFAEDRCVGRYPVSNYDIGYSTGGFLNVTDRLHGNLSSLFFSIGKGILHFSFNAINYAVESDLMEEFGGFAEHARSAYDAEIVEGMELKQIAWIAFVGWLAYLAVRGKFAALGGEYVASVFMLAIFTVLIANPEGYMRNTANAIEDTSTAILEARCRSSSATEPVDPDGEGCAGSALQTLQGTLQDFFVHQPYLFLNWDWKPEVRANCETKIGNILATGPHGTSDWPRTYMKRDEVEACVEAADWNASAVGGNRLFKSFLAGVAALFVGIILLGMAFTVLIAKFVVAVLFGLAPIPAALAVLPGNGRRVATSWLTTVVQAVVVAIGMSLLLSMMMIAIENLATLTDERGLIERWIVMFCLLGMVWLGRKRFLAMMQGFASHIGDRLARPAQAASGGGVGGIGGLPSASPGSSLFRAPRVDSNALTVATTGTSMAIGAGGVALSAAKFGLSAATSPVRGLWSVRKARRASDRIHRQNIYDALVVRRNERRRGGGSPGGTTALPAGGGGGGAPTAGAPVVPPRRLISGLGRRGSFDAGNAVLSRAELEGSLKNRELRLHDSLHDLNYQRARRRAARVQVWDNRRALGLTRWQATRYTLRSWGEGFLDNVVAGPAARMYRRNVPWWLGGSRAVRLTGDVGREIRGARMVREDRGARKTVARTVALPLTDSGAFVSPGPDHRWIRDRQLGREDWEVVKEGVKGLKGLGGEALAEIRGERQKAREDREIRSMVQRGGLTSDSVADRLANGVRGLFRRRPR